MDILPSRVMRVGIAVSDRDDWTARALLRSFLNLGAKTDLIDLSHLEARIGMETRVFCDNMDLQSLDCLVVRDMGRGAPQGVSFRFEALETLEEGGLQIINPPRAILRAANKFATSCAIVRSGLPTLQTTVTTCQNAALDFLSLCGTAVSKPLFGYKGKGIVMLTSNDVLKVSEILSRCGVIYLQEFVHSSMPRDIRAFVVEDRLMGAIYRVAQDGMWISNIARGGKAIPAVITAELEDLAIRASRATGTIYSGVDLLETPEGPKVIEVNATPSGKGLFTALGIDVTEAIASAVLDRLHR